MLRDLHGPSNATQFPRHVHQQIVSWSAAAEMYLVSRAIQVLIYKNIEVLIVACVLMNEIKTH